MNRFIFQLAVMAALLAGVQSEELRCSEGDKECLAMQMDDASMAVDLLASKLNINQQRKLAATQATTGVALHMDDPYTVRGTGICNRGWLRGDPVSTGEGCRTSCDDEADCNTYCYGTPPHQHWQCLRYDSRCDGLQMMLEGADMSMYTCFDKPASRAPVNQAASCGSWCAGHSKSWTEKCAWDGCKGCDECQVETPVPTLVPTPAPTPVPTPAPTPVQGSDTPCTADTPLGALPCGSNLAPPPGFVAKPGSGPCRCRYSGFGLDSCGDLCCANSPYTDPDPAGQYYYGNGGTRSISNLCYEQQARTYQCEQNQNYRSTAVPEDLPGSVTSGVATSQECANLCDATDGCNVYVHNVYGECYLKSRRDSQTADPEEHQTVSCIVED